MMHLTAPRAKPGTPIPDYLRALVEANPVIRAMTRVRYSQPPTVQDRVTLIGEDLHRLDAALALRDRGGLPFWDAVMLSSFNEAQVAEVLIRSALFHQSLRGRRKLIPRSTILEAGFIGGCRLPTEVLAVGSAVVIDGRGQLHLPLLDFHCRETANNDRLVASICRFLFSGPVAIFRSGKSYHAYGLTAVPRKTLKGLLYRSLLFAPAIDRAYVAHQLLEGQCCLRISPAESKPLMPEFKYALV